MEESRMDPERMNTAARALEDAFFAKENARLLAELRAEARKTERRQAMRDVISIKDDALVDHLLELGLGPETVLAVTLVPLAVVAWADGSIQPQEREAILKAASDKGIQPGSLAWQLLESWLSKRPEPKLVEAWKRYVQSLWPSLTAKEHDEIRAIGLDRARHVAEAAGGFLGLTSKISASEQAVLDEMTSLLAG
jgi:tellurite resistance protein